MNGAFGPRFFGRKENAKAAGRALSNALSRAPSLLPRPTDRCVPLRATHPAGCKPIQRVALCAKMPYEMAASL